MTSAPQSGENLPSQRWNKASRALSATALVLAGSAVPQAVSNYELNTQRQAATEAAAADYEQHLQTVSEDIVAAKGLAGRVPTRGAGRIPEGTPLPTPTEAPSSITPSESTGTPEVRSLTSEALRSFGVATVFAVPKYDARGPIETSNYSSKDQNSLGRYNNPPEGTAEIGLNNNQRDGMTDARITIHTSYEGIADLGVTTIDNSEYDPQTYGGWQLGDTIVLSGHDGNADAEVMYEIVPMPSSSVAEPVKGSPAVKFSKNLGEETSSTTETSIFHHELDAYVTDQLDAGAAGFIEVGTSCIFKGDERVNGHRPKTCAVLAQAVRATDGEHIYELNN